MRTRARTALSILSGALALTGAGLLAWPAGAQVAAPAPAAARRPRRRRARLPPRRFPAAAEVVALDIVVRDKKGEDRHRPAARRRSTVLEDGVPQKLTSSSSGRRSVDRRRAAVRPRPARSRRSHAPACRAHGDRTRPRSCDADDAAPRHVVLVFGRLGSNGRRLAQGAGEEFARKYVAPADDRERGPHRRRHHPAPRPLVRSRRRPRGRAQGDGRRGAARRACPAARSGPTTATAGQQMGRFEGGAGSQDLSQSDSLAVPLRPSSRSWTGSRRRRGARPCSCFSEGFTVPAGYEQVFSRPAEPGEPRERQLLRRSTCAASSSRAQLEEQRRRARRRRDVSASQQPGRQRTANDALAGRPGRR